MLGEGDEDDGQTSTLNSILHTNTEKHTRRSIFCGVVVRGLSLARVKNKEPDRKLYRGDRRRKKRNLWLFLGSLFFLWMVYLFLGGDYGLIQVISLKRRELELQSRLLKVRAKRELLLKETQRLKNDLGTVEKIARQELGMIGAGETRYQFPEHFSEDQINLPKTP